MCYNDNKLESDIIDNRWSFKKWLLQLSAPYKKSEAYKKLGDNISVNKQKESVFWDTDITYVVKYENAKLRGPNVSKQTDLNVTSTSKENNGVKRLVKNRTSSKFRR